MKYNKSITATVYIVNDNKVLLHLHKKYNTWFAVGGHLQENELLHDAAYREAKEETGFDIELINTETAPYIHYTNVGRVPNPFCILHEGIGSDEEFLDFIYIAKTEQNIPQPQKDESKIFRWFTKAELESSDIKPHIKNTALAVLDYITKKAD